MPAEVRRAPGDKLGRQVQPLDVAEIENRVVLDTGARLGSHAREGEEVIRQLAAKAYENDGRRRANFDIEHRLLRHSPPTGWRTMYPQPRAPGSVAEQRFVHRSIALGVMPSRQAFLASGGIP